MTKTVKYKQDKKVRLPRAVKQAIISTFVLLFLAVGAALGYVYWSGLQEPVLADQTVKPEDKETSPLKHVKIADNAPVGVSVQYISIPVAPGNNAMATFKTLPGAKCTIGVMYNGVASTDSGLVTRVANDYGVASWTWTVPETAPVGSWPVTVNCALNKGAGMVVTDLVVSRSEPLPQ